MAERGAEKEAGWIRWILYLCFLILFTGVYFFLGTRLIYQSNQDVRSQNQQAYLDAVYQSASPVETQGNSQQVSSALTRSLPHQTDGVVDPLWPWLLGSLSNEEPADLFLAGKKLNLVVSGVALIFLGIVAGRAFSFAAGASIALVAGFCLFLERSSWFLPDTVGSVLMLLTWICALSLMRRNVLWLYGILGFLLGLTFLYDALVWVIVLAFFAVSLGRVITSQSKRKRREEADTQWNFSNQIVGLAVLITAFMIVAGPRLSYANARYGNAFHLYSNYTIWLDSPEEARDIRTAFPDAESLAKIAPTERPGLIRFVKENGPLELIQRIYRGGLSTGRVFFVESMRWLILYVGIVLTFITLLHQIAARRTHEQVWRVGGTNARWMLAFSLAAFILMFFYVSVGYKSHPGDTRLLTLYVPLLVTFVWIAHRFRRQLQRTRYATVVNRAYLLMLIVPIVAVVCRVFRAF